jgi:hypothetical protein
MADIYGEKSLAFERRGKRLIVRLEPAAPSAIFLGETYFVDEKPSVTVNGKRYIVQDIV